MNSDLVSAASLAHREAHDEPARTPRARNHERVRLPYIAALPLMYAAAGLMRSPRVSNAIERRMPRLAYARRHAGSAHALDALYKPPATAGDGMWGVFERFWLNMRTAQAVRNRYRLVQEELHESIADAVAARPGETVRILELAAGLAQPLLEEASMWPRNSVQLLLTDIDTDALVLARSLAESYGVEENVAVQTLDALRIRRLRDTFRPHIVEVVGLIDYLSDTRAVTLLKAINALLPVSGVLITGNITPTSERPCIEGAFNWPSMHYRTPAHFAHLLEQAGFPKARCELKTEPHGIFCIGRATA